MDIPHHPPSAVLVVLAVVILDPACETRMTAGGLVTNGYFIDAQLSEHRLVRPPKISVSASAAWICTIQWHCAVLSSWLVTESGDVRKLRRQSQTPAPLVFSLGEIQSASTHGLSLSGNGLQLSTTTSM